jgi:hypothetical protein
MDPKSRKRARGEKDMKTLFLKAGRGVVQIGGLLFLSSGLAFAGENGLSPHPPLAPPISGLESPYLGTEQILRVDGENTSVIRCKSGYDSVLLFPGRKVRKIFLGGYSWTGAIANTAKEGVVVVDPPGFPPVASNLVVVFDSGVSFFRLKLVGSKQPFMARTVVRFEREAKDQRPK